MESLLEQPKNNYNFFFYGDKMINSKFLINADSLNTNKVSSYNKLKVVNTITELELSKNKSISIFNGICSNCNKQLTFSKYLCCVCRNVILCNDCEKNHFHPVIKLKNNKFLDLNQIRRYIHHHHFETLNIKGVLNSIFDKKIKVKLSAPSLKISTRPNSCISIPIYVENLSNSPIDKNSTVYFISRNCEDLLIHDTMISNVINPKEKIEMEIKIDIPLRCKEYKFSLQVYNVGSSIVVEANKLDFTLEVNDDEEEDKLNEYFKDFPKIVVLEKQKKIDIKKIIEEKLSDEHPDVIMNILENNKWKVDETVLALTAMKENSDKIEKEKEQFNENNIDVDKIDLGLTIPKTAEEHSNDFINGEEDSKQIKKEDDDDDYF